jgi:protoheme IX farnesyltransferase
MTGTIDLKALSLFLIMFLWQDPHFWALSLKFKKRLRQSQNSGSLNRLAA